MGFSLSFQEEGHIRNLVQECDDSNFASVLRELCEFSEYGSEGSIFLLRTCLDQINLHAENMQNVPVKAAIVSSVLKFLMWRPNFSTVFCESLRNTWSDDMFLENLSKALNLSVSEKINVSLALTDSQILEFRIRGENFCIALIEQFCEDPSQFTSYEQIQDIVMFLSKSEGLAKYVDAFTQKLSSLEKKDSLDFTLPSILSDDLMPYDSPNFSCRHLDLFEEGSQCNFDSIISMKENTSGMAEVIGELGYGCTIDSAHCMRTISLFSPLTESTIAKLLGTIVRTCVGHEDNLNIYSTFSAVFDCDTTVDATRPTSWNINVLVESIKKLAPETNWERVVGNLDHESFYLPDENSFAFFMSIYSNACQEPFPLHAICGHTWKNTEGQLSFLRHAVCAPPTVFTFAHSEKKLPNIESIHSPSGHGNQAWFALDLVGVLCELAERGHSNVVREILEYPLTQCPDLLLIGLSHSDTAYSLLQYEVCTTLLPDVIKNTMKSGLINHIWNAKQSLVLHGFIHTHSTNPGSIMRIFDICEELQILYRVLESTPFLLSIKLAALASQKELIDLVQWLNENFNRHKDAFSEVCLQFLRDNLADATTVVSPMPSERSLDCVNITQDSFQKVLKVLQAHLGQITSPQLSEEANNFYSSLLSPGKQSIGAIEMASSESSPDDVDTEANTYFHQMFSGQLTVEMMIQKLARFKEYPDDNREKRIFDCMIANLFEEYKFFPKYPDKQLKIAAVLFGSLIKNQLVTHLTLGIALRCVLDALRKSLDSKMFLFGAKALEQFRDRLVEWPQYCNHILQISHLRSTHAELVSFIERALARISSSQSESNGIGSTSVRHHQSPTLTSAENIEILQPVPPTSSSFQTQPINQSLLDDRVKSSASVNNTKLATSLPGFASPSTSHGDLVTSQKTIPPVAPAASSPSPGFLRSSVGGTQTGVQRQPTHNTGFGSAINIETLVAAAERRDTPIEVPSSEIHDKILFIINNISMSNLDTKAKEILDVLNEEYYPWFAQHMVMKRASIEPNFHDLYLKFLDKVNSRLLNREILKATYENCKALLRSDRIKSSSEERSLLKNLGSWLGKYTIGKNQALRAREIDPKVLIIEAYEKGLMIAVVPFTSKILEPCQFSLAYQPPNPWTMAILGLLNEIYNLPYLKMNLKFDIEVLFKNLHVDFKDVQPTSLLKDRIREIEGNPDFSTKDISTSPAPVVSESNARVMSPMNQFELQNQYTAPLHNASNTLVEDEKTSSLGISERIPSGQAHAQATSSTSSFTANQVLTDVLSHIVINPKLIQLGFQPHLQRAIPLAVDRAVADIITAVVTRSVTISLQTTKELIQKDYSMETDDSRIRSAAKLMVSSLAGSLAHVTCKEPLRISLSTHLRNILQGVLNSIGDFLEQAIQIITNDNLDLGCAMVEQAATDKALQSVDGEISPFLTFTKKQREGCSSPYFDVNAYAQGSFACVPESLRAKPGRLSISQQRVYEEFVKYPWNNQSSQIPCVAPASGQVGSSSVPSVPRTGQLNPGIYTMPSAAPGFVGVTQSSDFPSDVVDPSSIQMLSGSAVHSGVSDASIQHAAETISVVPSYSPSSTELLMTDQSILPKEFGRPALSAGAEHLGVAKSELTTTGDVLESYDLLAQKLETFILSKDSRDVDVQSFIQGVSAELHELILKCVNRDEAALAVAHKIFKRLYENTTNSILVGAHLAMLGTIRDVCKLVVKEITSWVVYSDEERKFNKDITVSLIHSELLNITEYELHLTKLIDGGRNKAALDFVTSLIHTLIVQESNFSMSEFYNLLDLLTKLSLRPGASDSLHQLIEMAKNSIGTNLSREEKSRQFMDKKPNSVRSASNMEEYTASESLGADPVDFREKVSRLFFEWFRICESPTTNDAVATCFLSQLQQNGLLKGDDLTDHFFRVITEISVSNCLASEQMTNSPQQIQQLSFLFIDISTKLVVLILKYSVDLGSSKVALLPKILSAISKALLKDVEEKKLSFNPRPYFRFYINLLMDLTSPDSGIDGVNYQVLTSFANAFHALQPLKVPSMSFVWLELVSHRSFMPKLLMISNQKGWPFFQRLLVDLFKFMEPYLRSAKLEDSVKFLYRGTLRVLLVLLHDFPQFLCDYHFCFCDVIPSTCIQMRNIILSAFPVNMRLPDPCTPNLKIDLLPEISQSPCILSDIDVALKSKQIKVEIDEYLKTKNQGSTFLTNLKRLLFLPSHEVPIAGTRYNVPLMNSLVLYVGMQAIQQLQSNSSTSVPHTGPMDIFLVSAAMDIFNSLIVDLDIEGRYTFLNAVANQLRYPNNHTHYFSFVLLYFFVEAKQEIIQEQITLVLLERLIVNRPHPWGLLITFIELIKNPRYDFWNKSFIHCAPEIEHLFDQVSKSCGGPRGVDDGTVSGSCLPGVLH